jgi:hypothetical protein
LSFLILGIVLILLSIVYSRNKLKTEKWNFFNVLNNMEVRIK